MISAWNPADPGRLLGPAPLDMIEKAGI